MKITNSGTPKGTASVSVGGATVGGVPVTIDQNGVHVQGQGSGLPYGQADDALNAALKTAGVQMYTVDPQTTKSANELTITATGVHVVFAQPVDQSGVPSQTVEHIVGEVFADSLAAPATAAAEALARRDGLEPRRRRWTHDRLLGRRRVVDGFLVGRLTAPAPAPARARRPAAGSLGSAFTTLLEQAAVAPHRVPRLADDRDRDRRDPLALARPKERA